MDLKNKKILVTGGLGFIGSAIVNKIINQNSKIFIIDSCSHNNAWRIKEKIKCKIFNIDLRNLKELRNCIRKIKPEIIFHLAALVKSERDINIIKEMYSINCEGTRNLIFSLNDCNYDLFINTGSGEEYGDICVPFKENDREKPVSPYSASKVATTYFCQMVANIFNKPIITVRPFLPYGPKQITKALIPSLIYSGIFKKKIILSPCEQTRDFIYIEDLADAYIFLAKNADKVRNMGIFNIGSGIETSLLDVVNKIKDKLGNTEFIIGGKAYRIGEIMHYYSDINKIEKTIDWEPKWSLEQGLEKTIEWWKNNKHLNIIKQNF